MRKRWITSVIGLSMLTLTACGTLTGAGVGAAGGAAIGAGTGYGAATGLRSVSTRVTFRPDGSRVTVQTRVDIAVKVLFVTAFRFKHEAEEVWDAGRLVSVKSSPPRIS